MSTSKWSDVKAKARDTDLEWESPNRVARRARMREEMLPSRAPERTRQAHLSDTMPSGTKIAIEPDQRGDHGLPSAH
jgi:hypothetical protein